MRYSGICIDGHLIGTHLESEYPEKQTISHPKLDMLECIKNSDNEIPSSKLVTYYYSEYIFGNINMGVWYSNNNTPLYGQAKHSYMWKCFIEAFKACKKE